MYDNKMVLWTTNGEKNQHRSFDPLDGRRSCWACRTCWLYLGLVFCRDITGRLTMQTCLGSPEDPII